MLDITETAAATQARLTGEMTIFQAEELFLQLKPLAASGKDLTLDVSGVSEMDSSAVQILLVMRDALRADGQQLTLANHSDAVLDVMAVMGLSGCFNDPVIEPADREHKGEES